MKKILLLFFCTFLSTSSFCQGFIDRIHGVQFGAAMGLEGATPTDVINTNKLLNQMIVHENAHQYFTASQLGYGLYQTLNKLGGKVLNTYTYASFLDHFALDLNNAGFSSIAVYYGTEAERCWKRRCKEKDYEYINAVINLGVYYESAGDLGETERWIDKGISLAKDIKKLRTYYYRLLNTKACIYDRVGRHEEALKIEEEIIKELKDIPMLYQSNLLQFQYNSGKKEQALSGMRKLVQNYKSKGLDKTIEYAELLQRLGVYCSNVDIDESISNTLNAITILKSNGTTLNRLYAQCLSSLATYYYRNGKREDAEKTEEHALNIWNRISAENSPERLGSLMKLSVLQFQNNLWDDAQTNLIACTEVYNKNIMYSMMQDGKTRNSIWNECNKWYTCTIPLFAYKIQNESLNKTAYNAVLLAKGILLNTEQTLLQMAEEGGPNLRILYDKWQNLKHDLASPHNIDDDKILAKQCEEAETAFMQECRTIKDVYNRLSIQWNNVRDSLSEKDVCIEFVDFIADYDTVVYAALVLQKESFAPKFVPIAKIHRCESLSHLYDDISLSELIWGRLYSTLKNKSNIYFSPTGELYNIPIESLPDWETPALTISKRGWNIFRLSSTRELILKKERINNNKAVIYGGLNYDESIEQLLYNERTYTTNQNGKKPVLNIDGVKSRGAVGLAFDWLPGTKIEAENIYSIIKPTCATKLFIGNDGTETSFKSYDGNKVNLMHIATHGFYVDFNNDTSYEDIIMTIRNDSVKEHEDALAYSGLLFAGVNNFFSETSFPDSLEDGVLTAKEISMMDLRGLNMVSLSACQTAQGDITSDGVFGLQRGFKKAGAQSILMSLWKVDDEATCLLMTEFYKNWIGEKMTKHDALEAAKDVVRSHKEKGWDDSKYWAAFILLDGLD